MKILITTDLYTVKTNGVVTSVNNLAEELRYMGHDVRVLTLSGNGISYRQGNVYYVKSFSLEKVYPSVRGTIRKRDRLIKELILWRPDVIHSQCEFFTFRFANYISKHTDAPIVHTYHTLYEDYVGYLTSRKRLGKMAVRTMSRRRLRKVDTVIAPTQKTLNVLNDYGMKPKMTVIPSGISLEQHRQICSAETEKALRAKFGVAEEEFVLLCLGRLGAEKNIDELLRAFSEFGTEYPDMKFVIVGDGPAREDLQALTEKLQLEKQVVFTGAVDPKEVQRYYQMADLFVSASTSETQGLVYIEAAANGLPLVCRKDPCLDGVLYEGENGSAFETIPELRSAVEKFYRDRALRQQAAARSRQIVSIFDRHHFAEAVEAVYRSAISG